MHTYFIRYSYPISFLNQAYVAYIIRADTEAEACQPARSAHPECRLYGIRQLDTMETGVPFQVSEDTDEDED
jgi:hypothetical protein